MPSRAEIAATFIVPIVAAVLAAVAGGWAGKSYDDLMAYFFPDKISGDYVTLNSSDDANQPPTEDALNLQSHNGVISGTGQHGKKKWVYSGYLKNGYIVLAYRSAEPTGLGFGTYFLADKSGNSQEYIGYFEGNVCPERAVLRCNAVLVKGTLSSPDANRAKTDNAGHLNAQCVPATAFGETSAHPCGQ